ncbi:DUF5710 domain-containing protein [Massilia sp. TWR1-2-2]
MFFLIVSYAGKDQARELGARWDVESKKCMCRPGC